MNETKPNVNPVCLISNYIGYTINSNGELISYKKKHFGKKLRVWSTCDGYLRTKINNKEVKLHRLFAEVYHPISCSKNLQVNHIDGNKENNSIENLEWVSQKENLHHAMITGLHSNPYIPVIGTSEKGNSILFISVTEAGRLTGAHQPNITKCCKGERKSAGRWRWEYA